MSNRILAMELRKAEELNKKSQLLNLNTRREYIEKLERMKALDAAVNKYKRRYMI